MNEFDLIVIGRVPGHVTAIRASQLGLKTAVEKESLGEFVPIGISLPKLY